MNEVLCQPELKEDGRWVCSVCGFGDDRRFHRRCGTRPKREQFREDHATDEELLKRIKEQKLIGDQIESALSKIGITKERVSKWIGGDCGCRERQELFNEIHLWALDVLEGKRRGMVRRLRRIIREYRKARKKAKQEEQRRKKDAP